MKGYLYSFILALFVLTGAWGPDAACAQGDEKSASHVVQGKVVDADGLPLVGVNVIVKNQPGLGTNTDIDGNYRIRTGANETLVFSYLGYATQEIPIVSKSTIDVQMAEDSNAMEEVVVVGAGYQKRASVVGAVASMKMEDLKVPTANISNSLAGNVPGIIAVQRSGEPGKDASEFWIRGISTFGANSSALVLVDGIERDFNEINVEDIESFSVLKDASATAIYGQRGANGVVLITTKRGKEGKVNINFKTEYGISSSAFEREFVDAGTYAALANEARMTRYQDPVYSDNELEIIKYGLDPDLYPNVDWQKLLLKDHTSTFKAMLNLSGGGSTARYYISGSYYKQDGIYNDNLKEEYGRGSGYNRYNYRLNTDVNITKSTILEVGIGGWVTDQRNPGLAVDDNFWQSIGRMTPIAVPLRYSNGQLPTYGSNNNEISPYVLLNYTGYQAYWENKVETNVGIKQDLGFITEGLQFSGRFSYDGFNDQRTNRLKRPALYKAERVRDMNGDLITTRIFDEQTLHQSTSTSGWRRAYGELQLGYDRTFGRHRVGGLLFYYMQSYSEMASVGDTSATDQIFKTIPQRNMALSGRVTYGYDDRYLLEFNFGYSGSENFEPENRFGFFPAIAAGWVISNEKFIKKNLPWLTLLKIRYSYGQVGNDRISGGRFPYLTTVVGGGGISFGNQGSNSVGGIRIGLMGSSGLTWEVATKQDLGLDLKIADRFDLTVDIYRDNRDDIFMRRAYLPGTVGLLAISDTDNQNPWGNVGAMQSEGIDGNFGFTQPIGKDFVFTLRGNLTYAHTKVLRYDEAANALWYRMTQGYKWSQNKGLIALGLFKDEAEIASSPSQYDLELMPGDIKYKDINGDGMINDDDIVPIGNTKNPELVYGFGLSAQWKGFDFSVLFQGTGKTDVILEGYSVFPFSEGEYGNVLSAVADPRNRWISREISGTPATERQDAIFPRLSYGARENNQKWSTWWLRDGRFLRLKNLELGYTLPQTFTRKFKVERTRIYFLGYNLACWAPFDWWDPEQGSVNGNVYPIQKTFTFGLNVSF